MMGWLSGLILPYAISFALVAFWGSWKSLLVVSGIAALLVISAFVMLAGSAVGDGPGAAFGYAFVHILLLTVAGGIVAGAIAGACRLADFEHRVAMNVATFVAGPVILDLLWL